MSDYIIATFILSVIGAGICYELNYYDGCVWFTAIAIPCLIYLFFKIAFSLEWIGENNGHDPYDID